MADIRRIQKGIEAEDIRMHSKDSLSTLEWVNRCREDGSLLAFKASSDPAPLNSELDADAFALCIQTRYQQECWEKHGRSFAGLDATHNTTYYENMSLFTVLVRDPWGHGIPVGWMLSSNAKEVTTDFFLGKLRERNPDIIPEKWMSDFDKGQINSIRKKYPESKDIFLCWWHVLHAWQQHFIVSHYPELWALLKEWLRITDPDKFDEKWVEIQAAAPDSVIAYLTKTWMPVKHMWSAVFRAGRSIWQVSDTNMLVEA
jgi:hypothetical protein